jgi:hypothetical protein
MTPKEGIPMDEEKKAMISPGSMLNSSEGLLSTGAMAALVQQMTQAQDWRVSASCALGLALIASTYCIMRSKTKQAEMG